MLSLLHAVCLKVLVFFVQITRALSIEKYGTCHLSPSTFTSTKYCSSTHNIVTAASPQFYSAKDVDCMIQVFRGCGIVSSIIKPIKSWSNTPLKRKVLHFFKTLDATDLAPQCRFPEVLNPLTPLWGPHILLCVLRRSTHSKQLCSVLLFRLSGLVEMSHVYEIAVIVPCMQ